MNQHELRQFYDIITASVEGKATDEQFTAMKKALREDPEAVRYYMDYMSIFCCFRFSAEILVGSEKGEALTEPSFDMELWSELAEYEAQAATLSLNDLGAEQKELIQKVEYQKSSKKINKSSLVTVIIGLAAALLLAMIVRYMPEAVQVAVLEDSINVQWRDDAFPTEKDI